MKTARRLALVLLLISLAGCGGGMTSNPPDPPDPPSAKYTTTFPLTENPFSEGGNWVNGGVRRP